MAGWIGVDLDGTLAHFDRWRGPMHIGLPIPAMAKRVHDWHARGVEVRIFTARASRPELIPDVQKWLQRHGFPPLAITNEKDFGMVELWDDRAIQVLYNTGKAVRPNRLEETQKAELFDPDVVYVDDDSESKEIKPTESEIEGFERNIKSSTDSSLSSLDDLMEALDDGDYAPGEAPKIPDALTNMEDQEIIPRLIKPDFAPSTIATDLPPDAAAFVSDSADTPVMQPKNSIVEIDLGDMDTELEDEIEKETADDTTEFSTMPSDLEQDVLTPAVNDDDGEFAETNSPAASIVSMEKPLDGTLDNQPVVNTKSPDNADIDLVLTMALDDASDEPISGAQIAQTEQQLHHVPALTAFPEDELDDFDDLPVFKVDRR